MTSQSDERYTYAAGARAGRLGWLEAGLPLIRLLRPHQWVKNAFVAAPLFFNPHVMSLEAVGLVALGILSFCFVASAVYVLNDLVDRESDRLHPKKRFRPLASGQVTPVAGLTAFVVVLALGLALAFTLDPSFGALVGLYFLVNVAYCFALKNISIIDVLTITFGFVLRVGAGATLIGVDVSVWILMCTGLIALFLALAKRRDDLTKSLGSAHRPALNGYTKPFLDAVTSLVLGALLVAYMMYATDTEVAERLQTDQLYLTMPFVVAGILRYLQISLVEERSGAPTVVVLSDTFLIGCMACWFFVFTYLIYF
ncbi:decaprenyl-phosphate phosphoribosyltransferase [Chthonobacter rhizosphaerae]|uniref:decaprenyl-phosphate phosphoribosyltransferase n=1 Tax=Chthonobacter rhizosphaerae TaxID=2735553 RepID=UPI0015EF964C|nr:decaprenyl-phosphate phosphoribosyltransferase [Chthonobacter rhizosphaerae]